jgi:hypothetical protein
MKALGGEYTLINMRIREIAMIKLLSEEFYKGAEYQNNILTILDSLSKHSLFKSDEIIAKNTSSRLLELVPGAKSPEFSLTAQDGTITNLRSFNGKHLYLHFYNPLSENCNTEIPLFASNSANSVILDSWPEPCTITTEAYAFLGLYIVPARLAPSLLIITSCFIIGLYFWANP